MRSAAIALMLCAVACSGGGGDPAPPASSLPTVKTLSVASAYTGMTYPITVYLPGGYTTSTDAKAVIYAVDDELEGAVIEQARLVQNIDAIVVSIGDLGSDRRFIDFELPGASAYFKFLTLELVPQIESQYRVDKTRRALIGYSLSGLAAVVALLEDNPSARYFSGYVIVDPSLQFNTQGSLRHGAGVVGHDA